MRMEKSQWEAEQRRTAGSKGPRGALGPFLPTTEKKYYKTGKRSQVPKHTIPEGQI